jgi:hypothetical protein
MNWACRPTNTKPKPNEDVTIQYDILLRAMNKINKQFFLLLILNVVALCPLSSQINCITEKTYIGVNLGHALVVGATSSIMNPNVTYLPVHIHVTHALKRHFGLTGMALYRLEKDYNLFTHEVGVAFGPSYLANTLRGFYFDFKFGVAYAFGRDFAKNNYRRTDIIVQPDAGYFINSKKNDFTMAIGLGFQSLLLYNEHPTRQSMTNSWRWNPISQLAHYYLPVINVSIGITR